MVFNDIMAKSVFTLCGKIKDQRKILPTDAAIPLSGIIDFLLLAAVTPCFFL